MKPRLNLVRAILFIRCLASLNGLEANLPAQAAMNENSPFETLRARARELAGKPYRDPTETPLPEFLKKLNYDQYHQIHFRQESTVWGTEPGRFQVQFFHPGYLFNDPVRVHVIEDGSEREVHFSPDFFDYGKLQFPQPVPSDLSFAGVRLLYPLNQPARLDEVAVFLGMSYFRLLGARQVFGASLRGLALDTAEPSGEEFPRFTEFHVEQPGDTADHIRVFALLESRRVTGAYEFLIQPGEQTTTAVQASLFFREEVRKLGLAPLTSMFFFGENRTRYFEDFRPEVHDSDGLLIETGDHRWLWRPLNNPPKAHRVTSFTNAFAFGLLQRDRNFDHYQDLVARPERRPSLWIEPDGDWGPGRVELVEIPSGEERNDNIVAYWVPERKIPAGEEFAFRYSISAYRTNPDLPPQNLWHVRDTRVQPAEDHTRFVLEFAGGTQALVTSRYGLAPRARASNGKFGFVDAQPNEVTGGVRVVFDFIPDGNEPAELRLNLERDEQPVSETWVYPISKR